MADMKVLYNLCEKISDELSEASKKLEKSDKLSAGDIEYLDKLTHMMKSLKTVIAMEESGEYSNDYSGNYSRRYDGSYGDGMSYNDGMNGSYARGRTGNVRRDSMGRYSRRGGYSRDDARQDMINELHDLMNDAPDDRTRQKFERFIAEMENG